MAVKTLAQIQADLRRERSRTNSNRKDLAPGVSTFTLLRDLIDSFDNIINNNVSIEEILEEVREIETHLHSYERWFEEAAAATGTHKADPIGTVGASGAFQIDAGNLTWGNWVQILGSADTPAQAGKTHYDLHKIVVEATERNEPYFLQVGFGASGAAALLAGDYTETVMEPLSNQVDSAPILIQDERKTAGTLAWARCMCPGQNTATLDFYFGIHEYDE